MEEKRRAAYYSIITYVHDIEVGEHVNVGIIAICEEDDACHWKLIEEWSEMDRAIRFFSPENNWDSERVMHMITSMNERLEQEKIKTVKQLSAFKDTRANNIQFSHLRGVSLSGDEKAIFKEVYELFDRLVINARWAY
jgi:hypothetical protein